MIAQTKCYVSQNIVLLDKKIIVASAKPARLSYESIVNVSPSSLPTLQPLSQRPLALAQDHSLVFIVFDQPLFSALRRGERLAGRRRHGRRRPLVRCGHGRVSHSH
ncbi:hypothetical protein F2Q68_00014659 [Brassica cretica]|uniref:Uncharacterized protein n=1 Tax=Brassica cretica TaxID=69181 RepID=A0A8S9H9G2_BRACR|nr:hypothetical protein F2Q68_00014659 [Brassica cretica]